MSTFVLTTSDGAHDVLAGDVTLSRSGPWVAHVELSGDLELSGSVTLTLAAENEGAPSSFVGTVRRSRPWQGRTRTVIVGGAGGLLTTLPPRDHVAGAFPVTALLVAQGIAKDSGETLADDVSTNLAGLALSRWVRAEGTATEALDLLASHLGLTWRVLADGTLWLGLDTFPESDADIGETWIDDGDDGRIDCAPPLAALTPGTAVLEHEIERVTYRVNGATARAELLYPVTGSPVEAARPLVYREIHGCDVVAQNDDGTLELRVDDQRIAEMRKVHFRAGIVGSRQTIGAGERVRIAFQDGDPAQPFAFGLDQDRAGEGSRQVARRGDSVQCGGLAVAMVGGVPQLTYTPPDGSAIQAGLSSVIITGVISSGSPEISIR